MYSSIRVAEGFFHPKSVNGFRNRWFVFTCNCVKEICNFRFKIPSTLRTLCHFTNRFDLNSRVPIFRTTNKPGKKKILKIVKTVIISKQVVTAPSKP